ncbi:phage DNA polymerase clamp loader subunit Gp62 [Yersinia phage phiR1-RT]|uniref:Sliding-clamp-loader small subunit n=1 Tax=Yersinia phage phiR1-RT TaxID=1206558 RepID=I7K2W7_BPPR1|nr:clamp loader of DNA polymerase [Yersinia phage phiR1-RT]CCI88631.1 phage DNA polymerase clamp loader subunit Gp62 [Yersinia phage phiR1-RT]
MAMSLFDDDEKQSDFDIAWMTQDWDMLSKLCEQFNEKPENEFFAILNDINTSKRARDVSVSSNYSKFMIDNMLSQHVDCIMSVNVMNLVGSSLTDQQHYNYYLNSIPHGKRFSKSTKFVEQTDTVFIIKLLMSYYGINADDAIMYKETMTLKNTLVLTLKKLKSLVTDDFLKTVTKNVKEQKDLKKQALEW